MNFEQERNTNHMEEYPIPKSQWESLEAVLFTKGNQLAKDLAKELNVPVQPLLTELRIRNSNKFVLIPDMEDTQYQCQGFKNHGAILMRCRNPVFGVLPHFCKEHQDIQLNVRNLQPVKRIMLGKQAFFLQDGFLLNSEGKQCGIKKGCKVILFSV